MKQKLLVAAMVVGGTLLSGCAVGGRGYYGSGAYVRYGPPAPRYYGAIGRAPGPGYVWADGYYDWRGNSYYWNNGRWMRPPRNRSVWVSPMWRQDRGGWRQSRGYWR